MIQTDRGQTLLELTIVVGIMVIVVTALVFATIFSLRNAQLGKNQAQATKLAQEGLEKVRSIRDRNGATNYDATHTVFSDLYSVTLNCASGNCYFKLESSGYYSLTIVTATTYETIDIFQRQIQIEDGSDGTREKKVTALVKWIDFAGPHESRLTTYLRKL